MELEFHELDRRLEHLRVRRPDRQRRLLVSLAALGQQTPIVVVEVGNQPGRYLVIDGYKRIAALEQLGRDTVEAVLWPLTTAEAVVLDRSMRMSERETALEEGWLLAELEQRFGYGLDELARQFDRSVSWVTNRLALVELIPESVQQQVRDGKLSSHVATKFLGLVARTSLDDCLRMAEAFARHRVNTRQAGQLYGAWRDGSHVIRQRVLEHPELFLKARRQLEPQPPPTPAAELLRDLEIVVAITKRARRRWRRGAVEMDSSQCEEARRQIDRALDQLSHLAQRIPREDEDVEQRSAHGDSGTQGSGSEHPRDRAGNENLPPDSAQGRWIELVRSAGTGATRESRTLPSADTAALERLQGEFGPGP
jgi:ParB family transcriptional regulator, chromosome partitioning protein